eukprot:c6571_g1_i2.p1 GENE.c6571_g1_i2~~c6571_g1_i2.p1  ORF type:complete len:431 (+),score=29.72 c6571_g1_i2:70-1362(+)
MKGSIHAINQCSTLKHKKIQKITNNKNSGSASRMTTQWRPQALLCCFTIVAACIIGLCIAPLYLNLLLLVPLIVTVILMLAYFPAPWITPTYGTSLMTPDEEERMILLDLPFNEYQIVGTHNSCHRASLFAALFVPYWRYTHRGIVEQLNAGIRHIEFDIWFNKSKRRWEIWHECVDPLTSTPWLFVDGLRLVHKWSFENPNHFPVTLNLDIKGAYFSWLSFLSPAIFGRGLDQSDSDAFGVLEREILHVWAQSQNLIIKPTDVRGQAPSPRMSLSDTPPFSGSTPSSPLLVVCDSSNKSDKPVTSRWPTATQLRGHVKFQLNIYHDRARCIHAVDANGILWGRGDGEFCRYMEASNPEKVRNLKNRGFMIRTNFMNGPAPILKANKQKFIDKGKARVDQLNRIGVNYTATNHPSYFEGPMLQPLSTQPK